MPDGFSTSAVPMVRNPPIQSDARSPSAQLLQTSKVVARATIASTAPSSHEQEAVLADHIKTSPEHVSRTSQSGKALAKQRIEELRPNIGVVRSVESSTPPDGRQMHDAGIKDITRFSTQVAPSNQSGLGKMTEFSASTTQQFRDSTPHPRQSSSSLSATPSADVPNPTETFAVSAGSISNRSDSMGTALLRTDAQHEPVTSGSTTYSKPTVATVTPSFSKASPQSAITSSGEIVQSITASTEFSETVIWESARSTLSNYSSSAPLRADVAPQIARQLVEVIGQAAHRPIEIALSPQELGRVRMSVVSEDGSITVNIIAERADTLELMRRHIDQLGQSFRAMGYESITFAFGKGGETGSDSSETGSGDQSAAPPSSGREADSTEPTLIHLDSAPTTGVDIRL